MENIKSYQSPSCGGLPAHPEYTRTGYSNPQTFGMAQISRQPQKRVLYTDSFFSGGIELNPSVVQTGLTLTFSADPKTLSIDNITVTGATKGALSSEGATRRLVISNITVANGATVSVSITSPAGYSITGTPQTAVVYKLLTQYIVNYDKDPATRVGGGSDAHVEYLVYFNNAKISSYIGGQVVGVRIYNPETDWTFTVKVYGNDSSTAPGDNLYSQDSIVTNKAWNDIMLTTPINIDSSTEIWAGMM